MEIGDLFVINKADRDGVDRTERELITLLEMASRPDGWKPPIVRTVATENRGIDSLASAIEDYAAFISEHPRGVAEGLARRISLSENRLQDILRDRLLRKLEETVLGEGELTRMASTIAAHERDPYSIVDEVLKRVQIKEQPTQNNEASPPGIQRVQHLGIAVQSIEKALGFWRDALGLEVCEKEFVADQGVEVAMLPIGEGRIELLQPTGTETPVGKFIAKRGQGIHHVCVETRNIRETLQALKTRNVRLIDEEPRIGAGGNLIAFVHPDSTGGVLVELVECSKENPN